MKFFGSGKFFDPSFFDTSPGTSPEASAVYEFYRSPRSRIFGPTRRGIVFPYPFHDINGDPGIERLVGALENIQAIHITGTVFPPVAMLVLSPDNLAPSLQQATRISTSD